ncbi:LacI family DNA-binding transcriptional regulator [Leucobacter tenebrionis]|uniref:LacI family DNA-binding transcriptional regulator n=1 Tax=Leucobacter tenebrionis TaxID=2873270 RepID=UPI001CA7982F|nr:LacI family DNA-binding transcriptional regulator [Leucobacter tenebrionis]QZY53247.1 LacI family transcriptional regulator [Leucobacter tenebrionis]
MAGQRQDRPVTIRDVALAAGVSKSTVSFVYSNPGRVSEANRQLVLDTAERLGFRPNWAARTINSGDGGFTGILLADLHSPPFARLVDYARTELRAINRIALMTSANPVGAESGASDDIGMDSETLGFFGDLRPRSLLVVGSLADMSSLAPLVEGIPTVLAGGINQELPFAATVRTDHDAGLRLLVEHLREQGHTRIAHLGGLGGPVGEARAAAYARAMEAAGLGAEIRVERADFSEASGYLGAQRLMRSAEPPTAITTVTDLTAVGALAAVADHPGVAVTGYGDTEIAGYRLTQMTTVRAHNGEIGRVAVSELLRAEECHVARRNGAEAAPAERREVLVEPALVVRRTA